MSEPARAGREVTDALVAGRAQARRPRPQPGVTGLAALQRAAGNAAVNALLLGKLRAPGKEEIESALGEMRRDEPAVDTVEKGLKAAQAVGVPVELEGPKPPASALAVTTTGFGPASVAPKKPVPPPKPVPAKSALGKAAAAPAKRGAAAGGGGRAAAPALPAGAAAPGPAALSADQLLQPPVAPPGVKPAQDPAFGAVTGGVRSVAHDKRSHPVAGSKAKEAQDAAVAPSDDIAGQAKAAKVDTMDAQQAGTFDKKAFIAAVKAAIEAKSPKTLKEADSYAESGKAGEVKDEIKGMVTQGKEGQAKDIEAATDAPPDTSKAVAKPVTPMGPEEQAPAPAVPAAGAVPKPAPAEQLNLEAGKQEANQEMANADVDEKQLAESNEPQFQQALADKKEAAAHADTAPAEYRKHEADTIDQSKTEAAAATTAGITGMQGSKAAALAHLVADKGKTKSKDEAKRAEVTAKVQAIFAATEADVKRILDGIDPKVEKAFEEGEASARKSFETFVAAKMAAYKADRYSGWLGGLRWAKDKLLGMPDAVNRFYEAGRELYLKQMDTVISRVADIVGNDLTAAKKRIAAGRTEIASYVKSLPANLQKVGAEASKEINDKFEQLESDVNSKQDALVDTLATKYVEARKGLDDRIEELQAENKGLVDKAIGAIKAVIETIRKLTSMLMNTLARVASVVGDIVKHPVRFLGNLIDGVKGGIMRFKDNILEHLRKGLMTWLFGALAEGGVELPEKFDLQGIIKLLLSLFGLTWTNIRNRLVKQIGEPAMAAIEKGVEIFRTIASTGLAGLWQMLMDKLGDIKEMILEKIKDFVITRIITAGITWLIGLLNPAAAFIKACKLIYDIIMFFVDNAERILKFVNTVIDSAVDIVRGNVGGVVAKIEDVLGQMVPILIGFLASAIGIGGIGEKIREIIATLQKPVNKAIDFVIKTGLKLAGPIIRGLKGIGSKVKAKVAAGKAWVKGKAEAGKAWVKGKAEAGKAWVKGKAEAGKKWVKGKAETVRDYLRKKCDALMAVVFSDNFTSKGKSHRLYTNPGKPEELYVASTPTKLIAAFAHLKPASLKSQIADLAGKFKYRMGLYRTAVKALRARGEKWAVANPGAVKAEIAKIEEHRRESRAVQLAIMEFAKANMSATDGPGAHAPGIGNIAPWSAQLRSLHGDSVPEWKMTAEHVIPDGLVRRALMALSRTGWVGKEHTQYTSQPTIMIYAAAGSEKTGGVPWQATRGGDQDLIIRMGNVVAMVRGSAGGDEMGLRKASGPAGGPTPKRYWRVYMKDQWERRVQPVLTSLMADALGRTKAAVKAEQKLVGDRRGANAGVRPTDGELDSAYQLQKAHYDALIKQRLQVADFD
ncbi:MULTISPECIES: phage tail protein [unclassified Mycolicibacterium]|uniref:phage tail protein n=1 Tax=unclassified Mycolicibacterium TaxID=2636767 RepID=UPI002EDA0B9B